MSKIMRISKIEDRLEVIESPRYIFFGPGAIKKISNVLSYLTLGKRIFLVTGGEITRKIADDVASTLELDGFFVDIFSAKKGDIEDVLRCDQRFKEFRGDIILGVGGGRPLDVAKITAAWNGVRYISVPTSPSHDGIASPSISFLLSKKIEEKMGEEWAKTESPTVIIADTNIIKNAPSISFKSGFGDLIGKVTAVRDWELAYKLKDEPYSEYGASMALLSAEIAMNHSREIKPGLEESTRLLVKALIGSGVAISIAGSSRPASGSEHLFSHSLDIIAMEKGRKSAPHGIQVGIGAIMMAYLQGQDWKKIRNKLVEAEAPVKASDAGIEREDVINALTIAHRIRNRYTILGESGLTRSAAEKLARNTGVIE
ncbi:MAG: sn-glycerol-1-phosphate dehydrogenase [Candidatus Methanodesulfokora washburnensis]|nr:sn-glycerol-1-phosphate dehydrogenase [Candidatus Methanodesulfokores washburnensis]